MFVQVEKQIVNLAAVAGAHWEKEKLFVHLIGGRFVSLGGDDARMLWEAMEHQCVDLRTGEARSEVEVFGPNGRDNANTIGE